LKRLSKTQSTNGLKRALLSFFTPKLKKNSRDKVGNDMFSSVLVIFCLLHSYHPSWKKIAGPKLATICFHRCLWSSVFFILPTQVEKK
jgi:hypothetical protein